MEEEDPFNVVADLSHVSSSQEYLFRGCRFSEKVSAPPASPSFSPDDDENRHNPAEIPEESTPILMESLPESPDIGSTNLEDLFHSPSEGSLSSNHGEDNRTQEEGRNRGEGSVPVDSNCEDSLPAVDLGRDTDLGFSEEEEVELAQRSEIGLNREARVLKRGYSPAERLEGEPSSKRLKISVDVISREEFFNSAPKSISRTRVSASVTEKDTNLMNSSNKLKGKSPVSALRIASGIVADEIRDSSKKSEPKKQQNRHSSSEVFRRRPDKRPINAEIGIEVTSGGGKKDIEDIDKFAYTGPSDAKSREMEKEARARRVLPPSITSIMEAAKSLMNLTTRAEAPASSNATQGAAAASETNVTQGTTRNESAQISKLKALANVLIALAKRDKNDEDLSSLSLMDIARRRGSVVTPSWWPPEGFK